MRFGIAATVIFMALSCAFAARANYQRSFQDGVAKRDREQAAIVSTPVSEAQKRKYSSNVVILPKLDASPDFPQEPIKMMLKSLIHDRTSGIFTIDYSMVGPANHDFHTIYNRWESTVDLLWMTSGPGEYRNVHWKFTGVTDALLQKAAVREVSFDRLSDLGCKKLVLRNSSLWN